MDENAKQEAPKQEAPKEEVPKQETSKSEGEDKNKADAKGIISKLEEILDEYMVKKAPFAIPTGGKEVIVKIAPYLIIIFAILAVPAIIIGLGLSAVFAPFAVMGGYYYGGGAFISAIFAFVAFVVEIMAVPGLFARAKKGWKMVFYASIISLIGSLLSLNIISGIIGAIIGWYILFQVKDQYK